MTSQPLEHPCGTEVRSATVPPEARGLARDQVRLAVVTAAGTRHTRATAFADLLSPGDVLVVNTSATLPAAVDFERHGCTWGLHVSTELDEGSWVVELRRPDNAGPAEPKPGEVLRLPGGVRLRILGPHPADQRRLWRAVCRCRSSTERSTSGSRATRSATPTSTVPGPWGRSRTCTPSSPGARRWPVPGAPSASTRWCG